MFIHICIYIYNIYICIYQYLCIHIFIFLFLSLSLPCLSLSHPSKSLFLFLTVSIRIYVTLHPSLPPPLTLPLCLPPFLSRAHAHTPVLSLSRARDLSLARTHSLVRVFSEDYACSPSRSFLSAFFLSFVPLSFSFARALRCVSLICLLRTHSLSPNLSFSHSLILSHAHTHTHTHTFSPFLSPFRPYDDSNLYVHVYM